MYLDCISSHCYCVLAFPLICLGRSRKTFPFSGHHVHLPFPHPPIQRGIKRVEWSHKKPCGSTQQSLHDGFWRFLGNKPIFQTAKELLNFAHQEHITPNLSLGRNSALARPPPVQSPSTDVLPPPWQEEREKVKSEKTNQPQKKKVPTKNYFQDVERGFKLNTQLNAATLGKNSTEKLRN